MFGKVKNYFKKLKIKTMDKEEYISYLRNQGVRIGTGCDIAKTAVFGTEPWLIKIGIILGSRIMSAFLHTMEVFGH